MTLTTALLWDDGDKSQPREVSKEVEAEVETTRVTSLCRSFVTVKNIKIGGNQIQGLWDLEKPSLRGSTATWFCSDGSDP